MQKRYFIKLSRKGSIMQNSVGPQFQYQQQPIGQQQVICNCPIPQPAPQQGYVQQQFTQPAYATQPAPAAPPVPPTPPDGSNGTNITTTPGASGVTIQIFNPSVGTPGAAPTYNVNQPMYYPPSYYTGQWGNGGCPCCNGINNNGNETGFVNGNGNGGADSNASSSASSSSANGMKKEKRDIVILTDSYIKNLENYLNSQDKTIRMQAAKEVAARLEEDSVRRDDKALIALVNKMIQDPYQPIKALGLALLSSRKVTGDDFTVGVLTDMRDGKTGYGEDAVMANDILLKMSGQIAQKEFEVPESKSKKKKKDE